MQEGEGIQRKYGWGSLEEIYEKLERLPDTEVYSEHIISVRGLEGTTASPLLSLKIQLTDEVIVDIKKSDEAPLNYVVWGSVAAAIILSIILTSAFIKNESDEKTIQSNDKDIDEVVEAEIID